MKNMKNRKIPADEWIAPPYAGKKGGRPRSFWSDVGEGYRIICHLSDAGDWQAIIETLAATVAAVLGPKIKDCRILDIGSGIGTTSASISKLLLTRFGIAAHWTLVEPDGGARAASTYAVPSDLAAPGGAMFLPELQDVPGDIKHDLALMVHSSYEVENLAGAIRDLSERLGINTVICLALPEDSPFFMVPEQHLRGCSNELIGKFSSAGFSIQSSRLTSRIRMCPQVLQSEVSVSALKRFTELDELSNGEFVQLVRTHWNSEVNFGDMLVVARSNSKEDFNEVG